jgi:hypothetical protein
MNILDSDDPNIKFMLSEYKKQCEEQEEVKRCGFRYNDYCWNCKLFKERLRWKLCDNGYITYWCENCY